MTQTKAAQYAAKTRTSVADSKAEIERVLSRFDCINALFSNVESENAVAVGFRRLGQPYMFVLKLPERGEKSDRAFEQECRIKWRELVLLIKAKLVAAIGNITTFEREFLPYAMLPSRQSVGEWAEVQLAEMIQAGEMPELLPRPQAALPERSNDDG